MNATVKDVMTTEVVAVTRETTFKEMAAVLRRYRVSALPVVDDAGRVLGVVSEADLLAKEALSDPGPVAELVHRKDVRKAEGLTADELMTRPPVTAAPDDPLEQAAFCQVRGQLNNPRRLHSGTPLHFAWRIVLCFGLVRVCGVCRRAPWRGRDAENFFPIVINQQAAFRRKGVLRTGRRCFCRHLCTFLLAARSPRVPHSRRGGRGNGIRSRLAICPRGSVLSNHVLRGVGRGFLASRIGARG